MKQTAIKLENMTLQGDDKANFQNNFIGNGITPTQQMISSCSGAFLTSVFVTPLDVVKIRLQSQKKPLVRGQCFLYCNGLMDHLCTCMNGGSLSSQQWYKRTGPKPFSGTMDAFVNIIKYEGVASLWSGLPPTLVMAVPATVVYFTCYEYCRRMFGYHGGLEGNDWWKPMIAGATARTWAVTVISPVEMIRTKLQSEQLSYSQVGRYVRQTIKDGGLQMLWKGWGPTILRDVPFSALYWLGYESMKSHVLLTRGSSQMTLTESFTAGAISGTIAGIITLPFDVIKTHRQIELGDVIKENRNTTTSTWKLMVKMQAEHGLHGLFTGIVPRLTKVAPACAIMISSYEYFKSFFREQNRLKALDL